MAETDESDALRRSLGLKPRPRPAAEPVEAGESAASPAKASEAPKPSGLGIRRRSGPDAEATSEAPAASGLDPTKKPTGKLGKEGQRILRNWYVARPELDLPGFLQDLEGTHGWSLGDGRKDREIALGFSPAFVLFVTPLFPDEQPEWVKLGGAKGEIRNPGLHAQPELTEKGFKVPAHLNVQDATLLFIAWKADETHPRPEKKPEARADESPRDARRREAREKAAAERDARRARAAAKVRKR